MDAGSRTDLARKILAGTAIFFVGAIALLSLMAFGAIFFPFSPGRFLDFLISRYFDLLNPLTMRIVSATAIDIWIARALAFTILYSLPAYLLAGWLYKLLAPISLFSRKGRTILVGIFWVVCVSMSFLSKNVYFSQDGTPQKRFYQRHDGTLEFFPLEMTTHPLYGEPLALITTELIKDHELRKQGFTPLTIESLPPGASVFLNGVLKGTTPLSLAERSVEGDLLVTLPGYEPSFMRLGREARPILRLTLSPESTVRSRTVVLHTGEKPEGRDAGDIAERAFDKSGVRVVGILDSRSEPAISNIGQSRIDRTTADRLRARLGAEYLAVLDVRFVVRDLGSADVGSDRISGALQGMSRGEVRLRMDVFDLRSLDRIQTEEASSSETGQRELIDVRSLLRQASGPLMSRMLKEAPWR